MKLELSPVVRYWEYNSKEFFSALSALRDQGASAVVAWIPWSHLETDRQHLLQKFVQQAFALGLKVKLGITPEIGMGYANGGIPEDLLKDRHNLAQDRLGQNIFACAPPNIHPLASLMAPVVFQRYGHFLLKFTQEMTEILGTSSTGELEFVVSDSLFKHYRNTGLPKGDHGDYAAHNSSAPMRAEKIFIGRALDFLQSRFARFKQVKITAHNVCTRDASLGRLLEELAGSSLNLSTFFPEMVRARNSASLLWIDNLSGMNERERNFLVSSGLVLFSELWLSAEDYLAMSPGFRKKTDKLIQNMSNAESIFSRPALSLVQNRYTPAQITQILQEKLGPGLRIKNSLTELSAEELNQIRLLTIDEGTNVELAQLKELISFAKGNNCTVVLFRSSLSKDGLQEIKNLPTFQLNHGWTFEVVMFDSGGHLLVIDGEVSQGLSLDALGDRLLAVSRLEAVCRFTQKEQPILSLSVEWKLEEEFPEGEMRTLFFLNSGKNAERLDLEFSREAHLQGSGSGAESGMQDFGKNFETTLPPLSVVPLTVFLKRPAAVEAREEPDAGTQTELAQI